MADVTNIFPTSRISPSIHKLPIKTHTTSPSSSYSRNSISQFPWTQTQTPNKLAATKTHQLDGISSTTSEEPSMSEIMEASRSQNIEIEVQTFGPLFRIRATSLESKNEIGRAEGMVRAWWGGNILHLDSMKLQRETVSMEKSIFGIGLFIGAVAIRHGYDSGCRVAQLLAINDSDLYHSKLVRFYTRIGFKAVHEVTGSSMGDFINMLVWGGYGTRMDADTKQLLIKWGRRLKSPN